MRDRPGVRQVPEGSGEQGEMEKTGCEIICGAPTTLAVKGLMMVMIIIIIITYIYNTLNDALSASRIHNKLKTILSKYIHIQNRQS